eukprot:CAMPEP_0202814978 /NCGR_PEP_ID=MMETSP1389-20130828/5958_1 /ASSEMBLY_ACC=CAM_ASM_000865 /TAXON_ID=302021 /ORGANISM="Rhodomonas sp., Strain CCMP768" /LENGTH=286 /DNA_ID=CAMNT_0049486851 /DNA_START=193 /DNA_END=1053 /DNA_ORIENTATION=-
MGKTLPRNIKDSVNQLRQSMQAALSSRLSRVDVEFPYAANLGVEGVKTKSEDAIPMLNAEDGYTSDRELARVIAEMFRGTELESTIVVAFPDSRQANKASKKWEGAFKGKVIVLDAKQKKVKTSGGGGFGAKAAGPAKATTSAVPDGTEVLLIVGPQPKQLPAVQKICSEVGMGCLVVLVNARLDELEYASEEQEGFFKSEFDRIYFMKSQPVASWNGGFLFRSFPDDWQLVLPRKIGPPRVLLSSPSCPTQEEMEAAFKEEASQEGEGGDIFGGIPNPFNFLQNN